MKALQTLKKMLDKGLPFLGQKREGSSLDQAKANLLEGQDAPESEHDIDTEDLGKEIRPNSVEYHRPQRRQHRSWLSIFAKIAIALFAIWGHADAIHRSWIAIRDKEVSCNCGESVEEAISRGCRYDSLAAAWLPDACRDDELLKEFERSGPNPDGSWSYYADRDKNVTLTLGEVSLLPNSGGHFFTTHEWHIVHCSFYWQKMFRAPTTGVTIEKRYDRPMHLKHCMKMFLARDPLEKMTAEAGVALHSDRLVVGSHKHQGHKENKEGGVAVGS
ncbi:hypothetical protein BKA64DRAFT_729825 [Cadophora sp. MPI-SDFR-AT-0126]|nr:hypothetical protein BKA64DRAFT_729825 [Leotiomycetes sp. MPI-SDFR-AT-0126]